MRTALVGREGELGLLVGWLEESRAGAARLALCGGEPGIGKTRLGEELAEVARRTGMPSVWGRAAELEGAPPYWLWQQVFRGFDEVVDVGAVAGRLGVVADLAILAPDALTGFAARTASDHHTTADRFRLFDAVTRFFRAVAGIDGLVVVLDDIHWAAPPSLLLLEHVMRDPVSSRVLVVATYRDTDPAFAPVLLELVRQPSTRRLSLGGLSAEAVSQQLAAISGGDVATGLARRVHDLTGGNPFYVGELARDLDQLRTPTNVRAAIARRAAGLSACGRELLGVASIVGRHFTPAVLATIVERPPATVVELLGEAVEAGLIEQAGGRYRFVHAFTREAIEDGLPRDIRARLHKSAGAAIERLFAGRIKPYLSDLAHHAVAAAVGGQEIAAAAEWSELAADEAMRGLAFEEAARLYRVAVDVGAGAIDDQRRYRLLLALARASRACGDHGATREASSRAAEVARGLGRPDLVGEAVLVMECLTTLAWDRALQDACLQALAGLRGGPAAIRARLLGRLAETQINVGDLEAAAESSRQALALAERCAEPSALVAALQARQLVRSDPDGVAERGELARRLARIGQLCESPATELTALSWSIDAGFARGDIGSVAGDLERMAWCVDQVGGPVARWHLLRYRAAHAQAQGDFTTAREHCDAAFASIEATRHPAAVPIRLTLLGVIDHHVGADAQAASAAAALSAVPGSAATPGHGYRMMDLLGPAFLLAEAGLIDEAAAKFRALGPVDAWHTPPFYRLPLYALGMLVAIRTDHDHAVHALRELLSAYRGQHVVPGTEVTSYLGPVELYLGKASRYLGELDPAVDTLETAVAAARACGTTGFLVEAQYELAAALLRRQAGTDRSRARKLIENALPTAGSLGMAPFRAALARLRCTIDGPDTASPLTPREYDVVALVVRGLSNRQIAAELYVSERTAQTHVQHILTKLGFTKRTQIAVWATAVRDTRPAP